MHGEVDYGEKLVFSDDEDTSKPRYLYFLHLV